MTDGRFSLCLCDLSACLSGPSVPVIVHDGRLALEGVVERAVSSSYLGALPAPRAATYASAAPSTCDCSMAGCFFLILAGACKFGTAWAGLRLNSFIPFRLRWPGGVAVFFNSQPLTTSDHSTTALFPTKI